ncbi:unnamed protein product [Cyclocybe aegerita]|uniref:Zn(2)-C6 fungal-type domain-containing protein n=1 Tax=Cyclocybe aegerita TaxID=1973307 RepID=A0A8S0XWH3_CYCAE|nr:unnamed protein product [Cyclocybe aegerita]
MAYRSHTASPAGSQSPSPSSSTNPSPYLTTTPLLDLMTNNSNSDDRESSQSAHGTPNQPTSALPRTQNSGKGGCWTCRVRRKKCDEQREGDSCKTCKRLTIKCLGWGPKRPDWMRDKKNVDAYKASIKAQLSSKGLIRGQPRHNPIQVPPHRRHNANTNGNGHSSSVSSRNHSYNAFQQIGDPAYNHSHSDLLMPALPGSSSSSFDQLTTFPDVFEPETSFHPYQSQLNPVQPYAVGGDPLNDASYGFLPIPPTTPNDLLSSSLSSLYNPSGHAGMHEQLVMNYFNDVRKVQFFFAGEALTDITYSAIVEEPRGAVSLAICALADLYSKQMRVSQGLEAPNQNAENSTSYLRHEALLRLENNNATHNGWTEKDALAALHLISLSQMAGGSCDWEQPFGILSQWLLQTNLHHAENPWMAFLSLSPTSQLCVKATLWFDVFSSLSVARPPKFLPLWKRLLGDQQSFWGNGAELEVPHRLRMDALTGCPDEAMLAIAEVSALAHWKASQIRNGCLSYPELVRRGTVIEQQLRRFSTDPSSGADVSQPRLHSNGDATVPSEEERSWAASLFREAANLYLHTVLSNSTPGVPEISTSVETIVHLFSKFQPSDLDRALVFPICFAGAMSNDSTRRDFLKGRMRGLNDSYGNLLQTRRLMEAVWQKRDVGGKEVDVRETIREQGLQLLLI